jgi:hypothetical protein
MATAKGKVVYVGKWGPLGLKVQIKHSASFSTEHGHLLDAAVKKGQEVDRGDMLSGFRSWTDWRIDFPLCWCRLVRRAFIYPADAAHKVNHFELAIQVLALKVGNRNTRRHKDPISGLPIKGGHRNPDELLSGVDVDINVPAGIDHLHHRAFKHLRHAFRLF